MTSLKQTKITSYFQSIGEDSENEEYQQITVNNHIRGAERNGTKPKINAKYARKAKYNKNSC